MCIFLSEIYEIEDCWRYDTTVYSTITNLNDWNLPTGNFKLTYELEATSRNDCNPQVGIGSDTSNILYLGQGYTDGRQTFGYTVNGSRVETQVINAYSPLNEYILEEYTYIDGGHTFKALGNTITSSKTGITMSKIVQVYVNSGHIRNLKVKPL